MPEEEEYFGKNGNNSFILYVFIWIWICCLLHRLIEWLNLQISVFKLNEKNPSVKVCVVSETGAAAVSACQHEVGMGVCLCVRVCGSVCVGPLIVQVCERRELLLSVFVRMSCVLILTRQASKPFPLKVETVGRSPVTEASAHLSLCNSLVWTGANESQVYT